MSSLPPNVNWVYMKQRFLIVLLAGFVLCPHSCFMATLPSTAAPFLAELAAPGISIERARAIFQVAQYMKEDRIDRANATKAMDVAKKKIAELQDRMREADRLLQEAEKRKHEAAVKAAQDQLAIEQAAAMRAEADRLRAEDAQRIAEEQRLQAEADAAAIKAAGEEAKKTAHATDVLRTALIKKKNKNIIAALQAASGDIARLFPQKTYAELWSMLYVGREKDAFAKSSGTSVNPLLIGLSDDKKRQLAARLAWLDCLAAHDVRAYADARVEDLIAKQLPMVEAAVQTATASQAVGKVQRFFEQHKAQVVETADAAIAAMQAVVPSYDSHISAAGQESTMKRVAKDVQLDGEHHAAFVALDDAGIEQLATGALIEWFNKKLRDEHYPGEAAIRSQLARTRAKINAWHAEAFLNDLDPQQGLKKHAVGPSAKEAAISRAAAHKAKKRHPATKAEALALYEKIRNSLLQAKTAAVEKEKATAALAKTKDATNMQLKMYAQQLKKNAQQLKSVQAAAAEAAKMFAYQEVQLRAAIDALRAELAAVHAQHAREREFAAVEKGGLQDAIAIYDNPRGEDPEAAYERRVLEEKVAVLRRENAQIVVLRKQLLERDSKITRLENENMGLGFDLEYAEMTKEMLRRELADTQERLARMGRQ